MPQFGKEDGLVRRHAVESYFALTFAISWLGALAVVAHGSAHPAFAHPDRASVLEDPGLAGIRAKPVLRGSFVRNRSWILRRNWLDGLRLPKDGTNGKPVGRGHRARCALGHLAHSGDRLFGNGDAARGVLAPVFPGVHGSNDRDARADCLDLYEHKKRSPGPINARQLDGLARGVQSWRRNGEAGNHVVRGVRGRAMANCRAGRGAISVRTDARGRVRKNRSWSIAAQDLLPYASLATVGGARRSAGRAEESSRSGTV